MANVDLNQAIRSLVAAEVENTLAPYRDLLDRMEAFFGGEAPKRAERTGRTSRAAAAAAPRRRATRGAKAAGTADLSRFHEGQLVNYRQGRGEFQAKVVEVDAERNVLVLERTTDQKRVERPADKVYEAA